MRTGTRWAVRGCFFGFVVAGGAYLGCSDDAGSTANGGNDGGAEGSATPPTPPSSGDAGDAAACADPPLACPALDPDASDPSEAVPDDLRCAGLYSCWSTKTVAANHREYTPAFTLWSDGAAKTRWFVLPPGSKIDTTNVDEWVFPVGTMVFKEFKLGGKRIETRRIWKASDSKFIFSVWRWNADETEAKLFNGGAVIDNPEQDGKKYEIPANTVCQGCHNGHTDKLLSIDAWDLAAGSTGITLADLKSEGSLTSWDHPTAWNVPQDDTGKLDKAIGFYYNNCGFCHKPEGPSGTSLFLNLPVAEALPTPGVDDGHGLPDGGAGLLAASTPIYQTAVGVAHTNQTGTYPSDTYKRIFPHDADHSVLPIRDSIRAADGGIATGQQMPPVVSRLVDQDRVNATKDWINALPP